MGRMDGDGIAMGNEYSAVESQHDEIRRLRVEIQSLKDANDRLQDERETLLKECSKSQDGWSRALSDRDALQREIDRLKDGRDAFQQQVVIAGDLANRAIDRCEAVQAERDALANANGLLCQLRDKLSRQLEERTSINGLLQEQYRAINDALHDVSAERDALRREVDRLNVELQSLKDANDRLQDERDRVQHQVEQLLEERREGGLEFDALSRQRDTLQREVDRLRHQTGEARQPDESDKLRADVRHLDAQLNAAGETIAQLRQEQARLQARGRELEGRAEDIRLLRKAVRTLAKLR